LFQYWNGAGRTHRETDGIEPADIKTLLPARSSWKRTRAAKRSSALPARLCAGYVAAQGFAFRFAVEGEGPAHGRAATHSVFGLKSVVVISIAVSAATPAQRVRTGPAASTAVSSPRCTWVPHALRAVLAGRRCDRRKLDLGRVIIRTASRYSRNRPAIGAGAGPAIGAHQGGSGRQIPPPVVLEGGREE
jgi:hypothetical protein